MSASAASEAVLDSSYIGSILRNTAIAFIVLQVVFTGLRYVSRYVGGMPIGLDDFLILPALIFNLALCAVSMGK